MNAWLLVLVLMNVLLMTVLFMSLFAHRKNQAEDQRLTKGLQLLQNKISILQDISDKSDEQVRKWVHLIEQKSVEIQSKITETDEKILQIEAALSKALDVSKIFYDQVPHGELADRQKTSKYVQAAKLAHQGFSAEQIGQKIDLSRGEIDMVIKMNKHQLQFEEQDLPAWVNLNIADDAAVDKERAQEINQFSQQLNKMNQIIGETAFDIQKVDLSGMEKIKQQFADSVSMNSTQVPQTFLDETRQPTATKTTETADGKTVRPFEFKKITVNKS